MEDAVGKDFQRFVFEFHEWNKKSDTYPFSAFGRITLANWRKDETGKIYLSEQLMTVGEIDNCVDALIKNLEELRKFAKEKFLKN